VSELRVSHAGGPGRWRGAIRVGERVVWTCPHSHRNRDYSSGGRTAARECAGYVLEAVADPDRAVRMLAACEVYAGSLEASRADVVESARRSVADRRWALEVARSFAFEEG